jgi:integrase
VCPRSAPSRPLYAGQRRAGDVSLFRLILDVVDGNRTPGQEIKQEGLGILAGGALIICCIGRQTPQHLQGLHADKLEEGLSPTSVRHLHAVLHRALGQAARSGLTSRNVADLVTPPRAKRRDMTTLSPEEARRFLEAAQGDRFQALYVLALSSGMRQGELLALHWANVDLNKCAA